jgi:hypothetical protein
MPGECFTLRKGLLGFMGSVPITLVRVTVEPGYYSAKGLFHHNCFDRGYTSSDVLNYQHT